MDTQDDNLPKTWTEAINDAGEWPFVDPDVMLEEEVDSFGEFPNDPEELPEGIIPYSEYEPWGKMQEETDRDYELFSYYRAFGLGRSYGEVARHFGISQPYVSKRANKHDWIDRVRAWDEHRERIYTSTVLEKTKKMAENHAGIAAKGIAALSLVFDEILERAEKDPELHKLELQDLSFRGLFTLADKAARALPNLMNAERLSRGLPTELTADIQIKENRVVVQSTEELSEIVAGLFNVLDTGDGKGVSDEFLGIEDAEVVEDDPEEEE